MKLFDEIERVDQELAQYSQQEFEYANKTARKEYNTFRNTLEEWFQEFIRYNSDHAGDLRTRFRLGDQQHYAALSELFIHHLLVLNNYHPFAHPKLLNTTSRPEFLVKEKNGPTFIIEVATVMDSQVKSRVNKFENLILDRVNKVKSPDFLILISITGRGSDAPPRLKALEHDIQRHIGGLDYFKVCKDIEKGMDAPSWEWQDGPWKIEFRAAPVTEEGRQKRDDTSRTVGTIMRPASIINLDIAIKDTVSNKAKKYGDLGIPYLIAINVIRESIFCDEQEILSALFGKMTVTYTSRPDGTHKTTPGRTFDGAWIHPKGGIRNTRNSGLLVVPGLTISRVSQIEPVLWHHPRAKYPFSHSLLNVKSKVFNNETNQFEDK